LGHPTVCQATPKGHAWVESRKLLCFQQEHEKWRLGFAAPARTTFKKSDSLRVCGHAEAAATMDFVKRLQSSSLKALIVLALAGACMLGASAANLAPVPNTVDTITPAELRMHLEFLASDELGGRYTLAPNFAIAARYLASRLEGDGFKGGADGSFFQKFEVVSSKADAAHTALNLTINGRPVALKFGEDFLISGSAENGEAQGQIAYAGAGISAPGHDDYAGRDVKGKIVLTVSAMPAGIDASKLSESQHGAAAAKAHGAIGILAIPPQRFARIMRDKAALQRFASRESISLAQENEVRLPSLTLTPEAAEKLLSAAGLDLNKAYDEAGKKDPAPRTDLKASAQMSVAFEQTRKQTQNVVGILDGTDPQLKNEYVVFSAHYDHLKTGANGEIYHGADDDGSGTSAVLAIAHAMSLQRPKRSILVVFHAGEELGLLGSEYNTDIAPAVPLEKIDADLNIDMIGRSKPAGDNQPEDEHLTDAKTVYLVGSNRISPELHELSEETNSQFQKLKLDYYYNDPNNPERIYFRSDHWNYAKHGIPIIFYFDGTHVDYHKPTDTVNKIDFNKMTEITRLVFETGWRIANLDHRLSKTP
jgi:Zn-dependent M28 family amino/carboxypeptidase